MKRNFKLFILFFALVLIGSASMLFAGHNQVVAETVQSEHIEQEKTRVAINSAAGNTLSNAAKPVGDLKNNLFLLGFKGEANPFSYFDSLYNNQTQFDFINQYFNTGTYSLKDYYNTISNGGLNLNTEIMTQNDDGRTLQIITLDDTREYYMPYYYYDWINCEWIKNPEGYFEYVLVSSSTTQTDATTQSFYNNSTFIANVYDDSGDYYVYDPEPGDTNASDGITSLTTAQKLVEQHSNYYLLESPMRGYREYIMICDAFSKIKDKIETANQDFDGDGDIDCLSISYFLTPDKDYNIGWSDLLWPHQWSISNGCAWNLSSTSAENLKKMGYSATEANRLYEYGQNLPKLSNNKYFHSYFVADFDFIFGGDLSTKSGWNQMVNNTSTQIHETGHMLGLPDLYVYNGGDNDASQVGSWSQMCLNPRLPDAPSLMTSYERYKMGWLDNDNVKQIKVNGKYTLDVTKGIEGDNVVGFYIEHPSSYRNQKIYLEYRSMTAGKYDGAAGSGSGLLIYYTNSNATEGNAFAPPYELYVYRKSTETVDDATFGVGESFGVENTSSTGNVIFFTNSANANINSGIVVTVESMDSKYLTFTVDWAQFDNQIYTLADFNNNTKLYNKLKSQTTGTLHSDSFVGKTSLDVSCCDVESLDFLEKFNLSTINYLNLAGNYITELTHTEILRSMRAVVLNGNMLDLSKIDSGDLTTTCFNFGIQFPTKLREFANKNLEISYYKKSTDIAMDSINSNSNFTMGSIAKYVLNYPNVYTISTAFTEGGFAFCQTAVFSLARITTPYNTVQKAYGMWQNDATDDFFEKVIKLESIDSSLVRFDGYLPNTTVVGNNSTTVSVYLISTDELLCEIEVFYLVRDNSPPEVEFIGGQDIYFAVGDTFVEYGINVKEWGTPVYYTRVDSINGENNTYEVIYKNKNTNMEVAEIDMSVAGEYIAQYRLIDSFGRGFDDYERTIRVLGDIIDPTTMDAKIYEKLVEISDSDVLTATSIKNIDELDLSNLGANTLKGLEQFEFKNNVIINLCGNNFDNVADVETILLAHTNIQYIYLLNNNYSYENILGMASYRQKAVYGLQKVEPAYVVKQAGEKSKIRFLDDLPTTLTLSVSKNYSIFDQQLIIDGYGEVVIGIYDDMQQTLCEFTILNIAVLANQTTFTKEYSETFTPVYEDIFTVEGIDRQELTVSNNFTEVELNKLGDQKAKIIIKRQEILVNEIEITITVVDTQKPTLTIVGDQKLYIKSAQEYYDKYANDLCRAYDGYDGEIANVEKNEPVIDGYGEYKVIYTATDRSGNPATLERLVYVGTLTFAYDTISANYNEEFKFPYETITFKKEDFTVRYKQTSELTYTNYDDSVGVKFSLYGNIAITIQFIYKYNSSLIYTFNVNVYIQDTAAPAIFLFGGHDYEIYAGQVFGEPGFKITDNSANGELTPDKMHVDGITLIIEYYKISSTGAETAISTLDTSNVGKFLIKYIATDKYGNTKTDERTLTIKYYPIDNVSINKLNLQSRYQQGKEVEVSLFTESDFITNPHPTIAWYVNGQKVKTTTELTTKLVFEEVGQYEIYAIVLDEYGTSVASDRYELDIYKQSAAEPFVIIAGIAFAVLVVGIFAIILIKRYKNRNFY